MIGDAFQTFDRRQITLSIRMHCISVLSLCYCESFGIPLSQILKDEDGSFFQELVDLLDCDDVDAPVKIPALRVVQAFLQLRYQ